MKHGMTKTKQYKAWCNMRYRVNNPKSRNGLYCGGAGIKYCPLFEEFIDWWAFEQGNGYHDGLVYDRIDNDDDYRPGNTRWVTDEESRRNKSGRYQKRSPK
jgi:hypothetical protein